MRMWGNFGNANMGAPFNLYSGRTGCLRIRSLTKTCAASFLGLDSGLPELSLKHLTSQWAPIFTYSAGRTEK